MTVETFLSPEPRAAALLRRSVVWDNHACMPLRPQDERFLPELQRHRRAGFNVVMLNIGFGEQGVEDHLRMLAAFRHWLLARPEAYLLIESVDDIERAKSSGRLAVGFDIEGANGIADQPSLISLYHALGVRWMLMAYNRNNRVGGGCQDEDPGLTPFGREVLAEMERVGMQVCLSHTGHRTAREVLQAASQPVIFSHSNCAAIQAHARNLPDELIRGCAATGGVVCINGVGIFLGDNDNRSEAVVRHIEHVVQLVGAEHVGLGLDYVYDMQELDDYLATMKQTFPAGFGYEQGIRFVAPEQVGEIVELLLARGHAEADVQNILGGNLMRVARQVWPGREPARQAPVAVPSAAGAGAS